jgi:hypothetical protein
MKNESLSSPQLVIREQSGVAVDLSHKQILSLYKKAEQSGYSFDTLKEVYQRGFSVDFSEQEAFNRVNSFIAGGAAADMDKDLVEKRGLWDNIHAKRERIKHGSGEHMRKPGSKGAPTAAALKASQTESAPCWDGYKQVGMKMKNKKEVPNCVPEAANAAQQAAIAIAMKKAGKKPHNEEVEIDEMKMGNPNKLTPSAKKEWREKLKLHHVKKKAAKTPPPKMSDSEKDDLVKQYLAKGGTIKKESYTGAEIKSNNPNNPANRFDGTDTLVNNYKTATPGQSALKTIKKVVREHLEEDAKGYKNPTGGLTQKGRDHYNRETGGHLKAPVTTPPSKLKKDSKAAGRRRSFCARMGGVKGPMRDEHGKPTRKALALRKWNC